MKYVAVVLSLLAQVLFASCLLAQSDVPAPRPGGDQDQPAGVEGRSPYEPPLLDLNDAERQARDTMASQELNRELDSEFGTGPIAFYSVALLLTIFVVSISALAIAYHSVIGALKGTFLRMPSGTGWSIFWNILAKTSALLLAILLVSSTLFY